MSSINSGFNLPIASSAAGISGSGKQSSAEKSKIADGSAAKTVASDNANANGLTDPGKSGDRDADGRQLYQEQDSTDSSAPLISGPQEKPPLPRSKDPHKKRGNSLDLDA